MIYMSNDAEIPYVLHWCKYIGCLNTILYRTAIPANQRIDDNELKSRQLYIPKSLTFWSITFALLQIIYEQNSRSLSEQI